MDPIRNAMEKIIEKCDVCIDGNVISKELLIKTFSDFISSTIEDKHHNVGVVLHTGSICFDAILLAYAAISNILYNETNAADLIHSLCAGDMVLCYDGSNGRTKPSKWIFRGFVNDPLKNPNETPCANSGEFILLQNDKAEKNILPKKRWAKIVPYFGTSKSMDSRGLRREDGKRYDFFRTVLEMQDTEIPRTIDTSTVIVISREEANALVGSLSFHFGKTDIKLTDLVPVSYYTENNQEYQYGINLSKNEPVIKLTGKVSVARKLLLRKDGNRHIGLIVLGEDLYRRGESELPELLDRQSIQYVFLCMHLDSEIPANLITNYEKANLFACTKEFLLSNSLPPIVCNPYTEQMDAQIGAIIDKEVTANVISGFISWEKYKVFKKAMYSVKSSEYDSDQKDDFIVQSYSLMNLFMTAVFPIGLLEELIESGIVDSIEKPELRLRRLEETAKGFPDFLRETATSIVSILEDAYLELYDSTPKETVFLKDIENQQGKIAVVVPKAYFVIVIDRLLSLHNLGNETDIYTMTANRFDNTQLYSAVIVVGNISGKRFDALRCRSSKEINLLLYECEKYRYKKRVRDAKAAEHLLNKRSTILTDDEYEEEPIGIDEDDLKEADNIDTEIVDYINSAPIKAIRSSFSGGDGKNMADIVAVAKFDSDEIAFFTKNYKAYVLDETNNSVKEIVASDLSEGDVVVFTRSTSKTRDIVEEILRDMINNKLVPLEIEDAYYKSRKWKKTLIDYMKRTGSSARAIADEMISNGVSVQESTIRGWLDEESHTVRPQRLDSIQQIALIAGNDELFDGAEVCFDAGGQIYKVRRQILKAIGQVILGEVTGNSDTTDIMTADITDRIKDAAITLQIEAITFVDDEVPINTTNRPITIDQ